MLYITKQWDINMLLGQNGYMIGVKHVDDAYCAYHMGDMMIPPTLKN